LPLKIIKEIKGMLSNHLISSLQLEQNDRPLEMALLLGNLYIQTFEKLPNMLPNKKKPM
tara:strand:+ start:163 stop:339 length:177 start_codon:yes stop_codon:yes gene_type:complete